MFSSNNEISICQVQNGWLVQLPVQLAAQNTVDYTDPETIKKMARIMTDAVQEEKLLREIRESNEIEEKPKRKPALDLCLPTRHPGLYIFSTYVEVIEFLNSFS